MTPEAKRRRREKRERQRQEYLAVLAGLNAAGKSCANCRSYGRPPIGMQGRICEMDSDSDGYVMVKPDHVCDKHQSRSP
jgi:hypothetical protein